MMCFGGFCFRLFVFFFVGFVCLVLFSRVYHCPNTKEMVDM